MRALNRESYDAIASAWDSARVAFSGRERNFVETLLEGLPTTANILDLGCGTGRPIAADLLSRGHRVTGVDQAEALLDLARSRFPDATWIAGSLEAFASATPFDAIVCWDALFHIDRAEHAGLFGRFSRMLRPRGRLMLTVGGSEHPAFTDQMFGETFFYDSHPPDQALSLLAAAGFTPILAEFLNLPTGGRDKGRHAIVASRD